MRRLFTLKFRKWKFILFYKYTKYSFTERLFTGYCRSFHFLDFTFRVVNERKDILKPMYQAWIMSKGQSGIIFESNSLSCVKAYIKENKHLNLKLKLDMPKAKD